MSEIFCNFTVDERINEFKIKDLEEKELRKEK